MNFNIYNKAVLNLSSQILHRLLTLNVNQDKKYYEIMRS